MAGLAASRTVPFGFACEPQRQTTCVIRIKASSAYAPSDPALAPGQSASLSAASLPAQEDQ